MKGSEKKKENKKEGEGYGKYLWSIFRRKNKFCSD